MKLPLKDGTTITVDFTRAGDAAKRIAKICGDVGFLPPEAIDIYSMRLGEIAALMDVIVEALHLKGNALAVPEVTS